jgi:hypothetical protein
MAGRRGGKGLPGLCEPGMANASLQGWIHGVSREALAASLAGSGTAAPKQNAAVPAALAAGLPLLQVPEASQVAGGEAGGLHHGQMADAAEAFFLGMGNQLLEGIHA